jgi:hypothetical protein
MIKKFRNALKCLIEKPRTQQDKELEIFKGLSPDRFDEAIVIDRMQTRLETIDEVFHVQSESRIPEHNPCRFMDSHLQRFSDLWFWQRKTATIEQKHGVGMAYISEFLGLGQDKAEGFIKGSRRAYYAVGVARQEILAANPFIFRKDTAKRYPKIFRNNIVMFWEKIREIFPDGYTDGDMDVLCNLSYDAVEHFMLLFEPILAEDARINRSLRSNEVFFTPGRRAL